jgi:hypothetical protein
MGLGSGIRDPRSGIGKNLFWIPDPGVKKAPDPGSGSATLVEGEELIIRRLPRDCKSLTNNKQPSPAQSSPAGPAFTANFAKRIGSKYHAAGTEKTRHFLVGTRQKPVFRILIQEGINDLQN